MSTSVENIFVNRNGQKVPHFSQADSRWGSRTLGSGSSLSSQGCAITCIAMFLKYYGREVTPATLDQYLDTHQGYIGNSVIFAKALQHEESSSLQITYSGKITSGLNSIINQRISNNIPTVARVDYGSDADENYNHFVIIVGKTPEGEYIINDPATRFGNGAEDPTSDNIISKTSRKSGYKLVAIDIFKVTDNNHNSTIASVSNHSEALSSSGSNSSGNESITPPSLTQTENIPNAKAFSLPVKLTNSNNLLESIAEYFNHTEKKYKGGYFPLGANTVWHGGLHIHTNRESNVFAMADGKVVAVKLAESEAKANGHYGSHNFILLKHSISGEILNNQFNAIQNSSSLNTPQTSNDSTNNQQTNPVRFTSSSSKSFYSLYMHLNNEVLDITTNAKLKEFSWLPKCNTQNISQSSETHLVASGETLESLARQWNTTIEKIRNANQNLEHHFGKNSAGTVSWYQAGDMVKRPSAAGNGMSIDNDFLTNLKTGEVVQPTNSYVKAGDLLWTSGMYGTPSDGMIHWEVFSEENLIPVFTPVEDPDNDCNMDSTAIFSMVEQGDDWFNDKSNIDAKEVINFYSNNPKAATLRKYSCKFLSEWAMDLDISIPKMKGRFSTFGLKERLQPYIWWYNATAKGVGLPSSIHVWHYNPIAFIDILNKQPANETPVISEIQNENPNTITSDVKFFIIRPTEEKEIFSHTDLTNEDIINKRAIKVSEIENGIPKQWQIGNAATLQNCKGLGYTGKTRLKKALLDGGVEGIPDISQRRKRIWASIWWSEGCLEAINQYDSAFLSFGPIQQTIGTGGGKGELSAALAYVKNENQQLFNTYFGNYGLDAVEVSKAAYNVEYAHLKLNGTLVNNADLKNEFRKFIWGYRCVKAMNDPNFRKLFLGYGFRRIEFVENMQKTINGTTVVFKDVFKSELAHALALDAHINLPAKVDSSNSDGIWVKALKAVKGTATGGVDIINITQNDEYEMINKLLFFREKCGMWSPKARAAMIIMSCKDLSDTLVQSIGYTGLAELYADADITARQAQQYKYNFLETTRTFT